METVPRHIGIIMDGNRRWAEKQGLPSKQGHTEGLEALRVVIKTAFELGVAYVSVYAFSTENWRRAEEEKGHLMMLLVRGVDKYLQDFDRAGIRIIFVGQRDRLDKKVIQAIERAEESTKHNNKGNLVICFNYGGQQEIVDAVKKIVASGVSSEAVTIDTIQAHLYAPEVPPLDLVIRTSGEQRLSNFMLWRAAYSELYFVDKLWPDFTPLDLQNALKAYAVRKRRFGK